MTLTFWQQQELEAKVARWGRDAWMGTDYGLTALREQLASLKAAPVGDRNNTLCRVAYRLGQLVAGEQLEGLAWVDLLEAADTIGLPRDEVRQTAKSGWVAGSQRPWQVNHA